MRDLEIRGAGNLLGPEQSGYMMSVGYDMYLQLLEEAVLEQRGEKAPQRTECSADLTVSANLPESYIPSGEQRMDIYRRIAALRTAEQSQELLDELIDRYGEPPQPVLKLMDVALLRAEAVQIGVSDISRQRDHLHLCRVRGSPRGGRDGPLLTAEEPPPAHALRHGDGAEAPAASFAGRGRIGYSLDAGRRPACE